MGHSQLLVGDVLRGDLCNCTVSENPGTGPKRVEGVGADWVVVRTEEGNLVLISWIVGDLHECLWEYCCRSDQSME